LRRAWRAVRRSDPAFQPATHSVRSLGLAHDFVSNPTLSDAFEVLPGGAFTVNRPPIPQNSALTALGVQFFLTPQWTLLAKFEGEFDPARRLAPGTGTLRYAW
jgi:uncharacterized protein with beta-barrel porin domain